MVRGFNTERRIDNLILTITDKEATAGEWSRRYGDQVLLDLLVRRPIQDSKWNGMCNLIQVQFREDRDLGRLVLKIVLQSLI